MFQETLDMVVDRYGIRYWNNPEFVRSKDRDRLIRLAELAKQESHLEESIEEMLPNPGLN